MVSPPFPKTIANLLNCNSNFSSRFAGNLARNGENEIECRTKLDTSLTVPAVRHLKRGQNRAEMRQKSTILP